MTKHVFRVIPGAVAPAGAADNPLANIRNAGPISAHFASIEARLTGSYSAIERAFLRQTWIDLYDTGLLLKLDALSMRMKNAADSLINWANPILGATNFGAAFTAGIGFQLVAGESDYISTNINPSLGGQRFQQDSASIGVIVPDATGITASSYLIGMSISGTPDNSIQAKASGGTTFLAGIQRQGGAISGSYAGSQVGHFLTTRIDEDSFRIYANGALVGSSDASASTSPRNGLITLGRQSSTYATMSASGWHVGGALTAQNVTDLTAIMAEHIGRMTA